MSQFFGKFGKVIVLLRWPLLLVFILATLSFAHALPSLKIDPSTEALFEKRTPAYQFYREFRENFGSDYLIAIAIKTPDYFTMRNLLLTDILTKILSKDPRVDRVLSLTNALDIKHRVLGVKVEPVIEGVLEGKKPMEKFKKEALSNPFFLGNLLSEDGKVSAILIRLKPKSDDPHFLRGYVSDLRSTLGFFAWPDAQLYVAGSPVEQHDFIDAIRRDQMFFIPSVSLFLILATFLIYRNIPSVVVAMSIVFVTIVWTFGTIALLGYSLNLINSLLAPVVMIIAVTYSIYLINLFSELRSHHKNIRESIALTLQHLGVPCFLTTATAVVGFLSLLLNEVPAVQSFGLFAALGIFYAYTLAMILMPILLPILPFQHDLENDREKNFFNQVVIVYLEKIQFHLKWILLIATVVLIALSFVGVQRIRVNTNLIADLPTRSPLAIATRFIDEHLAGVYSLGVTIERRDHKPFVTVETMKQVDALSHFLEEQEEITKVNSLATIIKKVHEARMGDPLGFIIPVREKTLQKYIEKLAESKNPDFWSFISKDYRRLRLEARMKAVGTEKGRLLEDRIWRYVRTHWKEEYDIRITGSTVLLGQMAERLVMNQIHSLGLAFVLILTLIAIFFRSLKMALLAAIPNLIPIVGLYGIMGYSRIELSTPTAMISSVVLGLVVDASIQFLYRFRTEFMHRRHYLQALHHTYRNVGRAMMVATLILVFGFATSIFATFKPTVYFGILTSITILFSLGCTLILLPIALIILKPFGPQAVFHEQTHRKRV
ncbi:MAG: MMPL family transporter [Candidatus Omnitrophica bacterium]|nr:MMPL family transporter [Candidatus Omnitrophota bacterium]